MKHIFNWARVFSILFLSAQVSFGFDGTVSTDIEREITIDTFRAEVLQSQNLVVLQPTAPWCAPCQKLKKEISAALNDPKIKFQPIEVVRLDYDTAKVFMNEVLGVYALPNLHFFYKGDRIAEISGGPGQLQLIDDFLSMLAKVEMGQTSSYRFQVRNAKLTASIRPQLSSFFKF